MASSMRSASHECSLMRPKPHQHHTSAIHRYTACPLPMKQIRTIAAAACSGTDCEQTQAAGPNGIQRRQLLTHMAMGMGALAYLAKPVFAASPQKPPEPEMPYTKTASGIILQEVAPGTGPAPQLGDTVLIDYVLRRPNGYFIYSTVEGVSFQPKDLPVGPVAFTYGKDAKWIQGLQEVVGSMRQGGKLRALIPPRLGYQDCNSDEPQPPTYATKRQLTNHCKEPLLFEIALLRVTPGKA